MVPFSEIAIKAGKYIYHLNIGQPDIKSPDIALDAVRNFSNDVVEYSHSAGFESYRKGLASYYQDLGIDVDYNDLMVTTGGSEALLFALNSCLDVGDEIIIPEPFYANYNGFSISTGVKVRPIVTDIKDGFAISTKYDSKQLRFNTPNIVIAFANSMPVRTKVSSDRWCIFEIRNEKLIKPF